MVSSQTRFRRRQFLCSLDRQHQQPGNNLCPGSCILHHARGHRTYALFLSFFFFFLWFLVLRGYRFVSNGRLIIPFLCVTISNIFVNSTSKHRHNQARVSGGGGRFKVGGGWKGCLGPYLHPPRLDAALSGPFLLSLLLFMDGFEPSFSSIHIGYSYISYVSNTLNP